MKVFERVESADGKSKALVAWLRGLGLEAVSTVLVVETFSEPLRRAARNVPWLAVETAAHLSVYQLLRARQVMFERAALLKLEQALSSEGSSA